MKSNRFSRLTVSLALLAAVALPGAACGPYVETIPTPDFFGLAEGMPSMADYEREENLRLWQSLTSDRIPLADIEEAVYGDSWFEFNSNFGPYSEDTDNRFYNHLRNTNDDEIIHLLSTAKQMEEGWREISSAWYYPESKGGEGNPNTFDEVLSYCRAYKGERLRDRYALQATRALFASRRYAECAEYVDSAFAHIPDSNLMKRMATRYKAGCWSRLGDSARADTAFAKAGDIRSISRPDRLEFAAGINPAAPQLIDYIRSGGHDSTFMRSASATAERLLGKRSVGNRGDWLFVMAYTNGHFEGRTSLARRQIREAMRSDFSSEELRDLARAYRMKLDAATGHTEQLLDDLKWIEGKSATTEADAKEWTRRCRNIIYENLVPALWKKKDYSTAILLCSYADRMSEPQLLYSAIRTNGRAYWYPPMTVLTAAQMRDSEIYVNQTDYRGLSFELMESLTSRRLASAYDKMKRDTPLYSFLRRKARTDSDYINELIGTLALREEDYARAEKYLSTVSEHYMRTTNIDKGGYLARDPFIAYPSRWTVYESEYMETPMEYEHTTRKHPSKSNPGAKLAFARRMKGYSRDMKHGRTADERGMARLMYAIGRRNSFEECWALTQYMRGEYYNVFYPGLTEWDDSFAEENYAFVFNYEKSIGHKKTEAIYDREVKAALAMMTGEETRAKAEYLLGNLKTIVKHYGNTATAARIRTSCDRWKMWL